MTAGSASAARSVSGFNGATRKDDARRASPRWLWRRRRSTRRRRSDYKGRWGGDLNGVTWVRPEVVIRAELGGWSRDGMVRQTSFKGFEEGRDPTTVVRETPVETAAAVEEAESEALDGSDADDGLTPATHDGMNGTEVSATKSRTERRAQSSSGLDDDDHRTATATKTRRAATTTARRAGRMVTRMKTKTKAEPTAASLSCADAHEALRN